MNYPLLLLVATIASLICSSTAAEQKPPNPKYDAQLAKKLGADERGMKSYVFVTLKTGPNDDKISDKQERSRLFKGHFANMTRLAKAGKLVLAGPFVEGRPKRGLLIFNVTTLDEARALIATDPAVEAGIFVFELTKFYGSAALMQVKEIHDTISQK